MVGGVGGCCPHLGDNSGGRDDDDDCIGSIDSKIVGRATTTTMGTTTDTKSSISNHNNSNHHNEDDDDNDDNDDNDNKNYSSYIKHDKNENFDSAYAASVRREGHINAEFGLTVGNGQPIERRVYLHVSAYLAFKHFNERSDKILSDLPHRLKDCNFYVTWKHIDTMFSPIHAAKEFLKEQQVVIVQDDDDDDDEEEEEEEEKEENCPKQLPFAVLGASFSRVSQVLAILGNAYQVPVMSASSTSHALEGLPFFSRTIPTNSGDAQAFSTYLDHLHVSHVAILYIHNSWGIAFQSDLANELQRRDIQVLSFSYVDIGNVEQTIQQLAESHYRYVIALTNSEMWRPIFRLANSYGIMGQPGYTWMFSEGGLLDLLDPTFRIERNDTALANAIHGTAIISIDIPTHQPYETALQQFTQNTTMQDEFIEHFKQPQLFNDFNFTTPIPSLYSYLTYDAAMALSIAACDTPGLFTAEQYYQTLLQTKFNGISGPVSLHPETHTRSISGVLYGVQNIVLSKQRSTPSHFFLDTPKVAYVNITNSHVHSIQPFLYADSTVQQPLALPPLVEQHNLVPTSAHIIGFCMGGSVLLSSIGWAVWTFRHRRTTLICASQPLFLYKLCAGTFLMGLSVIPLSCQDPMPQHRLDVACMSVPWLLSLGFVTSFSALFSKTWRLNQLLQSGQGFRRSQLRSKDVLWPFYILVTINVVILVAWTRAAPVYWDRIEISNYDSYGRIQESYGDCQLAGVSFMVPLLVVNTLAVFKALYQIYVARNLIQSDFSEASYLLLSMASIVETMILAIPVIIAAEGRTTASYLLRSFFVCVLCLTILLPMFVPRYLYKRRLDNLSASYRQRNAARLKVQTAKQMFRSLSVFRGQFFSLDNPEQHDQSTSSETGIRIVRRQH